MKGNDQVRHCGRCDQKVYDLSRLPQAEAAALVRRQEGRLCVRFYVRDDGTIVTADCWSRLRALGRRGALAAVALVALVLLDVWRFQAFCWRQVGRLCGRSSEARSAAEAVVPERPRLIRIETGLRGVMGAPTLRPAGREVMGDLEGPGAPGADRARARP
jgi:hypothetical protein